MSQNDFVLANQSFPDMRTDMNNALQALASNSSGTTEPATTYAYQMWYDETTDILKMRNAGNDGWISLATFDQTGDEWHLIKRTSATGSALLPVGTTAQRDGSPAAGYLRFNSSTGRFEGYTGAVWNPFAGAASVVQRVAASTSAFNALSGLIPIDDTKPQSTEGEEVLTLAITPTNASNIIRVAGVAHMGHSLDGAIGTVALFKNSETDPIDGGVFYVSMPSAATCCAVPIFLEFTAGGTSEITLRMRAGATSDTGNLNGSGGARKGGGALTTWLTATEFEA